MHPRSHRLQSWQRLPKDGERWSATASSMPDSGGPPQIVGAARRDVGDRVKQAGRRLVRSGKAQPSTAMS